VPVMTGPPAAMRRAEILERIQREGSVTLGELVRAYAISNMTAHRDLEQLASDGLVERIRGGARALPATGALMRSYPTVWEHRVNQAKEAKAAIAVHAATLITGGAMLFVDASSTSLALVSQLAADPPYELTVVTNSPILAADIRADLIHVVVCPGELDQHTRTITGRWTDEFIRGLRFDLAFVSAAGVTLEAGLTTTRSPIADVVRAARASADRTIGLLDSTKFGRASIISIAPARDLDLLITDEALPAETADDYRGDGVRLDVAPADR
jgi:DeoR/GlpR family transcriptional regulator of sugar metabolism